MTKTKRKPKEVAEKDTRIVASRQDAFFVRLISSLTGETQPEIVERMFRESLKRFLRSKGIDPDERWAEREAGQRS